MTVIDCLYALNKWWATGKVDEPHLHKRIRSEFSSVVKNIDGEKIVGLFGPRCCGKSTLLFQTVNYLLSLKTPARRVLMFSGDEPSLFIHNITVADILRAYCAAVLQEEPESLTAPVYVIIDELHRIHGWRGFIRESLHKGYKFKFIVSAPTRELLLPFDHPLRGQLVEIAVPPLSSQQFIDFYCAYRDHQFDHIAYKSLLPNFSLFENPPEYVESIFQNLHKFAAFRGEKTRMINEYLLAGGYPGYFHTPDLASWQKKLCEEIVDIGLYGDILSNYTIKSPEKLKRMLYLVSLDSGREQAYSGMGRYLSLNTVTVISHVNLLSQARLICVCDNYSGEQVGVRRKNKRLYTRDSGIRHALLHESFLAPETMPDEITAACIAAAGDYAHRQGGRVCFWRAGAYEAELVLDCGGTLLPVQVVYKNDAGRRDIRGVLAFSKLFGARTAVVITKDTLAIEGNVCYIPFWLL